MSCNDHVSSLLHVCDGKSGGSRISLSYEYFMWVKFWKKKCLHRGSFFSDVNYREKTYNYKEKEVSNNIIIANKNYIINYNLK